ncbi:DUF397 domain-containing protein [Streptomyces sp. NRRL S-37]|uniref:DUF397 domain-containing protein n=1 Tax=Streptomyces sp. NRRL S-37 TaxID=1463903 RepID=UPI000D1472BD
MSHEHRPARRAARRPRVLHKSSRSGTNGGDCVEVATAADAVYVRDSKAVGDGPVLRGRPGRVGHVRGALRISPHGMRRLRPCVLAHNRVPGR